MKSNSRIYIAGHTGLVGSAISRKLKEEGYSNISTRTSKEANLRDQQAVSDIFIEEKPEYVFLAAAKVGGILANSNYPAEFIYDNLAIQTNLIHQAYLVGVKKFLFLGSSCIYPKHASQPIQEKDLLTGQLEPTNESYAVAKIAGIKMCQAYNRQYGTNFISVMPTNLYGPGDNFNLDSSHVLPALIRKFHEAKVAKKPFVEVWGSGTPRREFLYIDDLASACLFLMLNYDDSEIINVGVGKDISIEDLALLISEVVGYEGKIAYDHSKPDGMPRKLLDVSRIHAMGWRAQVNIRDGIEKTYNCYLKNRS